jgi:hypothetical protein
VEKEGSGGHLQREDGSDKGDKPLRAMRVLPNEEWGTTRGPEAVEALPCAIPMHGAIRCSEIHGRCAAGKLPQALQQDRSHRPGEGPGCVGTSLTISPFAGWG